MNVQSVLRQYVGGVRMGEQAAGAVPGALGTDLAAISTKNRIYFQICFAVVVLLLVVSCGLVVMFLNDPAKVSAIFAATGLSIVGLIGQMISLWKQKVTADIVVVLARNLPGTEIKAVLDVLLAKL